MVIGQQQFSINQVRQVSSRACWAMTFTPSASSCSADATLWRACAAPPLQVCTIGQTLAAARGLNPKHAN